MKITSSVIAWFVGTVGLLADSAQAFPGANVLVAQGAPNLGYFYGGSAWDNITAALNAAAGSVTVTPNLNNLSQMLQFDALWIDQRWTTGALTPTEASNVGAFVSTGRRVVMFGENDGWTNWNNQILGIVGGSYVPGSSVSGGYVPVISHALTSGVSFVIFTEDGLASGGTPVFNANIATLWGTNQNVLTLLSVNIVSDDDWNHFDNHIFATNLANWIATPVPEPTMAPLFVLMFCRGRRRRPAGTVMAARSLILGDHGSRLRSSDSRRSLKISMARVS